MKVTREGKGLVLTTGLVALAALNTGNNLIYMLTALMFTLAFLDIVSGYRNLKKIHGTIQLEEPLYAGATYPVTSEFSNSRRGPAFLVRLAVPETDIATIAPRVDANATVDVTGSVKFKSRGRLSLSKSRLSSGFPFGFFINYRTQKSDQSFLIYPELTDVQDLLRTVVSSTGTGLFHHPGGEDFTDIRSYRFGDPMRHIHWKATARTGNLMVKEFRVGIPPKVTVVLDNSTGSTRQVFEKAVSITASLIETLFQDGYRVRLLTMTTLSGYAHSQEQLRHIMDELALVQQVDTLTQDMEQGPADLLLLVQCRPVSPFARLAPRASGVFHATAL